MEERGRPRKDDINTQQLIINLAQSGMTNKAIANATGLSLRAITYWLANTELGDTVKIVREASAMLNANQKMALNKSAVLAAKKLIKKHKVEEIEERRDGDGNLLYTQKKIREVDPNAGMVQMVLKYTDPKNWSDQYLEQQTNETDTDNKLTFELIDEQEE